MRTPPSIVTASALVFVALAHVYAAPNLNGEWKLNATKSNYGPVPKPDVMIRKITHKDPSLSISTYQKGQQGEVTTELKYTTDGKPTVNTVQGSETRGTAKWQGNQLLVENERSFQGTQLKTTETWTLSPDGKTLTIATHITLPQQALDLQLVFDKQ
jgi:hypothetical protein